MHRIPPPSVTLSVLALLSLHVTTSFSSSVADAVNLSACDEPFDCGPLKSLKYPFAAGDQSDHCGSPEFRLTCSDSVAELVVDALSYRVIRVDPILNTMTVARSDLWNETCPSEFNNTTLQLSRAFSYGVGNTDLTMFYRCNASALSVTPENQFWCYEYLFPTKDAYFIVGPVPSDPILKVVHCNESVTVPILDSIAGPLTHNRSMLREALMLGFNVNYTVPFAGECSECRDSNGRCGFDSGSGKPLCVCGDRVCRESHRKKETSTVMGLSIAGACLLGMFIVGLAVFLLRRRKKRAEAALAKSRDISSLPSSKSDIVLSSTTKFSLSTPSGSSYTAFSKSGDVEKGSTYFGTQVFSYDELEEATDNFDRSRELGEGGFGTVYYGKLADGREVAVKRLYENNFRRVEQFMNEVEILTRLQHHNLVKLYGCTSRRSRELLLVYEFVSNGTVADHIHVKETSSGILGKLSWPVRLSIAAETAEALAYLHRSDIIHRDVKTNNILLDAEFHVKVADFGLSKLFPTDVTHVSTAPQGTPGYVDPEYYQCYQLTTKSDVYSFGVVLIELISSLQAVDTNRHRHDINLANMAVNKVQNHLIGELVDPSLNFDRDEAVRKMATDVAELAFRCLQQEREMRPSMEEVLAALRAIQKEEPPQKPDVVDITSDDVGLLKNLPPPLSPDSDANGKWPVSDSTTANSY